MHAGLAAGAGLAALPVILHLFMKQKPKRVIFPALRLIRERQKRAKKQLKIKNWLLLAARMLLLALMALALAQPSINSESALPLGTGEVATALGLVIDTSLSMDYTERGQDRLTEAKTRAKEILQKATNDTEVFVIDSADPVKPVALTPASALKRIESLTLKAANRPLNAALVQAHQVVGESKLPRREVYVLTDLTASSWELTSARDTEALTKVPDSKANVQTYILRLTPKDVRNVAIVAAEPSSITPSEGEPVEIVATIRSSYAEPIERVAEFFIDGEKNKRDQKVVKLAAHGEEVVSFLTPAKLEPGLHQGMIKLSGQPDPMSFDDVRYFTFHSQAARKVLVVADTRTDAEFVEKALAPYVPGGGDPAAVGVGGDPAAPVAAFQVERVSHRQFSEKSASALKEFVCVFLLNLDRLTSTDWGRLRAYVLDGGGLVVAPGDRADLTGYVGASAEATLPGKLEGKPTSQDTNFGQADFTHPLFSRYPRQIAAELANVPVYHHWEVKPVDSARVLLRYTDGAPALIERIFKGARTGRVLLWTTPLSRRVARNMEGAWNEFPQSWTFLSLLLETVPYLAGMAGERLNYDAGENAVLIIDPARRATNYAVQGPDPKLTERLSVPATSDTLVIATPSKAGQWTVTGQSTGGDKQNLGFSLNALASESEVVPLKPEDLAGLFGGKDRYQVADDPTSLERAQAKGRFGFELFPLVMFLILGLVTAENLLANKFHRDSAKP